MLPGERGQGGCERGSEGCADLTEGCGLPTAQGSDRSVDWLDQNTLPVELRESRQMDCPVCVRSNPPFVSSHLVAVLGVEQDPSKLDDLGRVLGNVDAVLVAGSCNMDDDVAVEVAALGLGSGHV